MSKFKKHVTDLVGEAIFLVFGWLVCVGILSQAALMPHRLDAVAIAAARN
jgi:hypothetical protein